MANIIIPIPTREAIAYWLKDLFHDSFRVSDEGFFWYTLVDEKPEMALRILDHYKAKHPEAKEDLDVLRTAIHAVTEDEAGAVAEAATTLG